MKPLSFLLVLLMPLAGSSQYKLSGTIRDRTTRHPLALAEISILNSDISTVSDDKGQFTLEASSDFDSIRVILIGYELLKVEVKTNSRPISILVRSIPVRLHALEVNGLRSPGSAATLTQEELERYSGLSLRDALNTIAGVDMQSRSPWGGQHILIRGYYPSADNGRTDGENFNGLGFQLSIDNIPVTDATGLTIMDDIDFSNLGRVEVFKGPSPLQGSYTAGAVQLFTPVPAPDETSISQEFLGGSYGLVRTNTTFQSSAGNSDLWINYGHQGYTGFRPNDASRKDFASVAGHLYEGSRQILSYYISYNHSYEELAGEIDSADFYARKAVSDSDYLENNSHVEIESFRAGVTQQYRFNSHLGTMATLFATGSTLNQRFAHGFNKEENLNFGGKLSLNFTGGNARLRTTGITGISFQQSGQNAQGNFILPFISPPFGPSTPFDIPSDAQNHAMNLDFFSQWQFLFPSQILLTAGAGLNFNGFQTQNLLSGQNIFLDNPVLTRSFPLKFSPGISLLKTFHSRVSVYGSVNWGYAPPTLSQMTNSAGKVDTRLLPESSVQYEAGTKGSQNRLTWALALFDLDITHRLVQETAHSESFYTNAGEERNLGAEFSGTYALWNDTQRMVSAIRPWISWAWSDFRYVDFRDYVPSSTGNDSTVADYSGNKVAGVSPFVLNLGVDLKFRSGFYGTATYRHVGQVPVTFDNSSFMKPYDLLSAKLGYRHNLNRHFAVDAFLGADNILGSTYYSFLFVGQNIQELAQANDPHVTNGGGDGYILPAPYKATAYGGATITYTP
ncbi:MAG TPA: TonB-dependent receptor [Chitinophagaceae bacterium]|nr:TonB-dependent receptor [Chitinophagaceae bacterium]